MSREEKLKKLAEEVQNISSPVDPSLWGSIGSQIGSTAGVSGAAATGLSVSKLIGAVIVGAGLITAGVIYFNDDKNEESKLLAKQDVVPVLKEEITQKEIEKSITVENETRPIKEEIQSKEEPVLISEKKVVELEPKKVLEIETPMVTEFVPKEFIETRKPSPTNSVKEAVKEQAKPKKSPEPMAEVNNVQAEEKEQLDEEVVESDVYRSPAVINRLPNIFSPNGDGVSDEFFIDSEGLEDFSIVIMDQQSNVVWKSADPKAKWNGYGFNGEKVPPGRYMYFIAARDVNGEPLSKTQLLTIQY